MAILWTYKNGKAEGRLTGPSGRKPPAAARFDADGTVIIEKVLEGDSGEQLALLAPAAQTGEGLSTESAGPLFGKSKE